MARFCEGSCAQATTTMYYLAPPAPLTRAAPLATLEPNAQYRRSVVGCDGCAYATAFYRTPVYHSLDQDRAITFLYSSALAVPRGMVVLDVNPNSTDIPASVSLSLLRNGTLVGLTTGGDEVFYAGAAGTNRLTAQFDATALPEGVDDLTAILRNRWADGTVLERTMPVRALVNNGTSSAKYGRGWRIAGLHEITLVPSQGVAGPLTFVEDGNIVLFANCGYGCWTAPPGEASSAVYVAGNNTVERRYQDSTVAVFNASSGVLNQVRDRLGYATTYLYDGYYRLSQMTDPAGKVTTIAWSNAPGQAGSAVITTPGGRTSVVQFNGSGEIVSFTDPDNVVAMSLGHTSGRLTSVTNRIGGTTTFAYDQYGGLSSVTGPAVPLEGGGVGSSVTSMASREVALFPAAGNGSIGSPFATVTADETWLRMRNQHGDSTRMLSNGAGDATAIVIRNGQGVLERTTITYNDAGQPLNVRSTAGTNVAYSWIGANLTEVHDVATQVRTGYTFNAYGQVLTASVNSITQVTNSYTTDGRSLLQSSTSGTATTTYAPDSRGRALSVTDGQGHVTTFTYEPGGFQNLSTATREGKTTQLAYDSYGRPNVVTDAASRVVTTGFDLLNRPSSSSFSGQPAVTWTYNDATRSYVFRDQRNEPYTTVLNVAGAPVSMGDPNSQSEQITYDIDGRVAAVTSREQRRVAFQYDALGRVWQTTTSDGLTTTVSYDTTSKWVTYSNAESTDSVYIDGKGAVTRQVSVRNGVPYVIKSLRGSRGQLQELRVGLAGGERSLTFGIDDLGRRNYLSDPNGYGTSITYNAGSDAAHGDAPNGNEPSDATHEHLRVHGQRHVVVYHVELLARAVEPDVPL